MKKYLIIIFCLIVASCSNNVKKIGNDKHGDYVSTHKLVIIKEKKFALDSISASKPTYIQMLYDTNGKRIFSTLNRYKNSIYLYDYNNSEFLENISFDREGPHGVLGITGYYIKNTDSIYLYNRPLVEIAIANSKGLVKNRISLKGKQDKDWSRYYPQYEFSTICPIIENSGTLLLTGFNPFELRDSLIDKFYFTASVNINNNEVVYHHNYPREIFGNDANWGDPAYMQVFPALSPSGEFIHSFPPSHNLYISDKNSTSTRVVYGGSSDSKAINSIDWDATNSTHMPRELLISHILQQDLYSGILYDSWRKVYYRFMLKGIPYATTKNEMSEKNIIIIILDEHFNYLGEENIGNGKIWNWNNSFVTQEGLNIEYIDIDDLEEYYLNFKIFKIEKHEEVN